ncbi:MAG: type II toxin-antitoxin system Phd/YefM family antitoxin [Deltaproteobacteria bacterium]|nr:type II toxin-antitoxin system Phd/YefM family antitoxin [Deltaproteobacteria bacterium]
METRIPATKAVREFSEIVNRIRFRGDTYIIERNGKPVARMGPADPGKGERTLNDLKAVLANLPRLGGELDSFAADLDKAWRTQLPLPEEDGVWG